MQFKQYTPQIEHSNKIVVDGSKCGAGLELSHWPGNRTPEAFKADLSVESVLRFLRSPGYMQHLHGIDIVTNDHFDTDGLLSVWAILNPSEALKHESALKNAAEAGDFYHFTSATAVKFDFVVRGFEDPERSPCADRFAKLSYVDKSQLITDALLVELPDLLYHPDAHRNLWQDAYSRLLDGVETLNKSATVREWPSELLTTLICPSTLDHYTRNILSTGHRVLEAVPTHAGTQYQLFYREYLWYDIVSRFASPRHALVECAETLNELEGNSADGTWGVTDWSPALRYVQGTRRIGNVVHRRDSLAQSKLPVHLVEEIIREQLAMLDSQVGAIKSLRI